jgi:hypothetical protein
MHTDHLASLLTQMPAGTAAVPFTYRTFRDDNGTTGPLVEVNCLLLESPAFKDQLEGAMPPRLEYACGRDEATGKLTARIYWDNVL